MRTYRFINRHGVEVDVAQEGAIMIFQNPSMKFVGEVITKEEIVDVTKTRKVIIEKIKQTTVDGKNVRTPIEVEEDEEYETKEMKVTYEIDPESYPTSRTDDVSRTDSGTIRMKTVVDAGERQTKRSNIKGYK